MKKYQHGGDWAGYKIEYGSEPLDFSANISPLGLPESVKKAAIEALDQADRYPDPQCRKLREKIAGHLDILPEQILCGNGAADLIDRLVQTIKPKKALLTAPTFGEYRVALERCDTEISEYMLQEKNDFRLDEGILDAIKDDTDIIFICEPNNPTGVTAGKDLLKKIHEKCLKTGTLLCLDECFNDFLDEPEKHTLLSEIEKGHLIILRAFTKFYAMAGLRLGFCISGERKLLEEMSMAGQPWSVSHIAQEAGCAALDEKKYGEKLSRLIRRERSLLREGLETMGCRVVCGEANYLLFFHEDKDLCEKLRKKGILLRSCANYNGLGKGWYRAAVKNKEDNEKFLQVMRGILEHE